MTQLLSRDTDKLVQDLNAGQTAIAQAIEARLSSTLKTCMFASLCDGLSIMGLTARGFKTSWRRGRARFAGRIFGLADIRASSALALRLSHKRRELKFLHRSPRCRVFVPARVDRGELRAEQRADGLGAVAGDREARAFLRPVQRKGRNDGVAAASQCK
ncbi:MAG: hypothetical protein JOZ76_03380, partial [Bradyrhizobium sp.]|nr:hypothetical protein [Bradyrhizobium sp.]